MIYNLARKIHRIFMFAVIVLTLIMWLTGQVMSEGWTIISDFQARNIHRISSRFFSLTLGIMITSGLIMYFYPLVIKLKRKK